MLKTFIEFWEKTKLSGQDSGSTDMLEKDGGDIHIEGSESHENTSPAGPKTVSGRRETTLDRYQRLLLV